MTHIQFHETRTGAEFYRRTMPELVKQLTRVADALERVAGETAPKKEAMGETAAPAEGQEPQSDAHGAS